MHRSSFPPGGYISTPWHRRLPHCLGTTCHRSCLTGEPTVERVLSSLAPGYTCVAMKSSFAAAAEFAVRLGRTAAGAAGRVLEINAFEREPAGRADVLVVYENETLGRNGRWLASADWKRTPDLVVVGDALALGFPFGAVLARGRIRPSHDADSASLARVAAAFAAVESEGLLQQGAGGCGVSEGAPSLRAGKLP